ncbi:MAG: M20/M25/M40 family metallo-hydrolase [Daejeonella sp.]
MKKIVLGFLLVGFWSSCAAQKPEQLVKRSDVERIIRRLSADDMQGRGIFTLGIEKAAIFIENEFKQVGLKPLSSESGFRQSFSTTRIKPATQQVIIDGQTIPDDDVMVISDHERVNLTNLSGAEILTIKPGENFFSRYRTIVQSDKTVLVLVDREYADAFKRLQLRSKQERIVPEAKEKGNVVFILGVTEARKYSVNFTNHIENSPLSNVVGVLPGKSKEKELVIFSGHYDHLGIIEPVQGDSIANGADDDASGITAMISLAKYYKKLNSNERTLVFVAFTAEESGGFGSQYFSEKLNPEDVVAMFNIEMIGKNSKFGKNTAFITGYEKSDFGEILQRNLEGTGFKFYPDPYPKQNLFYRSDNATLAALGVPAHTISTDQIDTDKFYHTVNDGLETLDINNIVATIKAIALSSRSIIAGSDTPKRIPKLK